MVPLMTLLASHDTDTSAWPDQKVMLHLILIVLTKESNGTMDNAIGIMSC